MNSFGKFWILGLWIVGLFSSTPCLAQGNLSDFLQECATKIPYGNGWYEVAPPFEVDVFFNREGGIVSSPSICQKTWLHLLHQLHHPPFGKANLPEGDIKFGAHTPYLVATEEGPRHFFLPEPDDLEYLELAKRLGAAYWMAPPDESLPQIFRRLIPRNKQKDFRKDSKKWAQKDIQTLQEQREQLNQPPLSPDEEEAQEKARQPYYYDAFLRNYLVEILFRPLISGVDLYNPAVSSTRMALKHFRTQSDARDRQLTGLPNHREFLRDQLNRPAYLPELESELYTKAPQAVLLQSLRTGMHLFDVYRRSKLWFEFEPHVVVGATPGKQWHELKSFFKHTSPLDQEESRVSARTFWNVYNDPFVTRLREQIDFDYTLHKRMMPTMTDVEGLAFLVTLPLGGVGGSLFKAGLKSRSAIQIGKGLLLGSTPWVVPTAITFQEIQNMSGEEEKPHQKLYLRVEENPNRPQERWIRLDHGVLRLQDDANGTHVEIHPSTVFLLPENSLFQRKRNP